MTQNIFEIPLTPGQAQKFYITLNNVDYEMVFKWVNAPEGGWAIDILDANGNEIVAGIPMTTGEDLLGQYGYLMLGGALIVQGSPDPDNVPTFANLGDQSHLYYLTVT